MSSLLKSPKTLTILIGALVVFLVSIAGGALGDAIGGEFGGGFLSSPIAHIQLPAEAVLADELFPGFTLTNTMVATWLTIVVLVAVAFLATRSKDDVPRGVRNLMEAIIEAFLDLSESIAGAQKARRFFPLAMTIFLFIVTANWLGILPGFGTIGRIETLEEIVEHKEHVGEEVRLGDIKLQIFKGSGSVGITLPGSLNDVIMASELDEEKLKTLKEEGKQAGVLVPFLRSANTDVNTTLAIALVAMFMVHFWGFTALGFLGHIGKFLNFRAGPIGLFVGILEGISELARVISFTFRLFGNIFAGEVLLIAMAFLIPVVGIIPFLGLELFVGMIQAFIFSMLTLVFATMATLSHNEEAH